MKFLARLLNTQFGGELDLPGSLSCLVALVSIRCMHPVVTCCVQVKGSNWSCSKRWHSLEARREEDSKEAAVWWEARRTGGQQIGF